MTIVTLTDGSEAEDVFVRTIESKLRQLLKIDEPTLLQLLMKCEDPNYGFLGSAQDTLSLYQLWDKYKQIVPEPIHRIVMCAVKEDRRLGLSVVSPIATTA